MGQIEEHDQQLKFELKPGNVRLSQNGAQITGVRGLFIEVQTPEVPIYSTESVEACLSPVKSGKQTCSSQMTLLPVNVDWTIEESRSGIQCKVRVKITDDLELRALKLCLNLKPEFSVVTPEADKLYFSPQDNGYTWQGFPTYNEIRFDRPDNDDKTLTCSYAKENSFYNIVVKRSQPDKLLLTEFIFAGSVCNTITLHKDDEFQATLMLNAVPFRPMPLYYPRDLFADGEVRRVLLVSTLSAPITER